MASPLADRLRPQTIDDMVGQRHLLGPGKALRRIIESGEIPNLIFYGPSGVGKTTLASIIARQTNRALRKLNGTTAGTVELCVLSSPAADGVRKITLETAKELTQKSALRYDKDGDEHYDLLSAFQKSMRGSDPDAAVHYLARLLEAGDLPSVCRRLMVTACEDVGLAYPQIIPIVKACVDAAFQVGLPEARLCLADGVILVSIAPKSNSAHNAINEAMEDVRRGKYGPIPRQLQNKHFDGEDNPVKGQFYQYAHDFENHWVDQQYLPDVLKNVEYYHFGENKNEQAYRQYWEKVKGRKL